MADDNSGTVSGRRAATAAGFYGTAAATLIAAVIHTLFASFPFPPTAVAQSIVGAPSGAFDSFFISRIGHWAGYLSVATAAVVFACSGLVVGWLASRMKGSRGIVWTVLFAGLWLITVVLYSAPSSSLQRGWFAAVFAPVVLVGAVVSIRSYAKLSGVRDGSGSDRASAERPETPLATSRRYFLKASGVGAAGVAIGLANIGALLGSGIDPGTRSLRAQNLSGAPARNEAAGDAAFDSIQGLSPELTPVANFYTVDKDLINPFLDAASWRLYVHGNVEHPRRFTHSDLLGMPVRQRYQTLECISNPVGGNLISTGRFAGVRLSEVIGETGPGPSVRTVIFRSAGGYTESIPIDLAMDPNTWVVVGLNGYLLPRVHGFPARILSVGTYGMKNPKWLTEIELSDRPVYEGYWEVRGWAPGAQVQTMSRFDVPADGATVSSPVTFAGVASAADRGISKVEVSTDGGTTWSEAQLKSALSPYAWRLWRFAWTPSRSGSYQCSVRASDGDGNIQGQGVFDPFPRGTAGIHTRTLTVA